MESLTGQFLSAIGSPFSRGSNDFKKADLSYYYSYSLKNRMPLHFLEAVKQIDLLGPYIKQYDQLVDRYSKIETGISRVSKMLDRAHVPYSYFKSLKPYKEVTVDIDVLVFGREYHYVIREFLRNGYILLGKGPLSTTFHDSKAKMDFDVYDEVGVSRIIYLDKYILSEFVNEMLLSDGNTVRLLFPEADLLAVIAHSIIKEQMYVLSEYYTTLYYLTSMKETNLKTFSMLVDKCRMNLAVKTHLGITALLHLSVHNKVPLSLKKLMKGIDIESLDLARVAKKNLQMPYKYHPLTIAGSFIEKFGDEKTMRSFVTQILSISNPRFASSFIKKMFRHVVRETY